MPALRSYMGGGELELDGRLDEVLVLSLWKEFENRSFLQTYQVPAQSSEKKLEARRRGTRPGQGAQCQGLSPVSRHELALMADDQSTKRHTLVQ
jgi:hypothetical protein